jgi:hypothetical protein
VVEKKHEDEMVELTIHVRNHQLPQIDAMIQAAAEAPHEP